MITIPGRIPILIHPLFWLVAFLIGWLTAMNLSGALLGMLVVLFSVLFHEFGHALTAQLFGQKTRIELAAFGGFTYREGRKLKLWEEFLVVLNGPIAGFLLFLATYAIYKMAFFQNPLLIFILKFAFMANFFWTIINLIPVMPLDGGHLLSILLEAIFGFKGIKAAVMIGLGVSILVTIIFLALNMFWIGALFMILVFESFRSLRYYRMFVEKDRDADLQALMKKADAEFQLGNAPQALELLEEVRKKTKEGILYMMATQEMAEIYKEQRRYEEAYELLVPLQKSLTGEHLVLFHFVAFMHGDFETVIKIGSRCFQESPSAELALLNAYAYGACKEAEPAVGWLECAVREGLSNVRETLHREELDPIRDHDLFKEFARTHYKPDSDSVL